MKTHPQIPAPLPPLSTEVVRGSKEPGLEQTAANTGAVLESLSAALREMVNDWDDSARRITKKPPEARLRNLQRAARGIDAPIVHRPPPRERHMRRWTEFVDGARNTLGKRAVRFLCWLPEVACDPRFLTYVEGSEIELAWRSIAGLVRSCHSMWGRLSPESPSVHIVRRLLTRSPGSGEMWRKWQAHSDALLAAHGPRIMAHMLLRSGKGLAAFVGEWRIEPQSAFFREVAGIAAARCRTRLGEPPGIFHILLFRDLLPWPGWNISDFKAEIGAVILHRPMDGRSREMVQRFILNFEGLGDPRLPANRIKWMGVPGPAQDLLVQWLGRENPYVFAQHVYQQGRGWVWTQKPSVRDPLTFEEPNLQ